LWVEHSDTASQSLLDDLRSDRGMGWVPTSGFLTKIAVDADAAQLSYDLAIDASGQGVPSWVQAGFDAPNPIVIQVESATWTRILALLVLGVGFLLVLLLVRRPAGGRLTPQG